MYLLGFLPKENRLYLIDKEFAIISYTLQMSVLEYQTAIVRGEDEVAAAVLESIPQDALQTVAKFLESQGKKELALELSTDLDFKFELAVQLGRLEVAYDIAMRKHASGVEVTSKWRQLGDLALGECNVDMAEECMAKANDLGGWCCSTRRWASARGSWRRRSGQRRRGRTTSRSCASSSAG